MAALEEGWGVTANNDTRGSASLECGGGAEVRRGSGWRGQGEERRAERLQDGTSAQASFLRRSEALFSLWRAGNDLAVGHWRQSV